ncbi:MAG TPA: hypothetical protein DDY49_04890 [Paenibacillaceae bacterium]|nr:hypothetical protein [Paenibacillaceae bacterium]
MTHFFYKIFILFNYSIKININKMVYFLTRLIDPNANESKWSEIFTKYIRIHIIILYLCWLLISIFMQILFSYVPLPSEKINVLLMVSFLLGAIIITGYSQNNIMTSFIILSHQSYPMKKRLVICNALLRSFVSISIITLILLPFLVTQWILNGWEGARDIAILLFLLALFGITVDFLKYLLNLLQRYQSAYTDSFFKALLYILIYYYTPAISKALQYFIDGYILNLYNRENGFLFLRDAILQIPFRLDGLHIHWKFMLFSIIGTICMIVCMMITSPILFRDVPRRTNDHRIWKVPHYGLSLFFHFFRKYGLFNHQIAVTLVLSYLLSYYFSRFDFYSYISIIVPVFILVYTFLIVEDRTELLLLLKRYRLSSLKISFLYSQYLIFQYLIYKLLFILLGNFSINSSFILDFLGGSIFGLVLLYSIISIYVVTLNHLEGLIDLRVLHSYSKYLIYIYLSVFSTITYIISSLQVLPEVLIQILVPILMLIIFTYGIQHYQNKYRRI